MSESLKPCPFCGGSNTDATLVRGYKPSDQSQPIVAAGCFSCGATGPYINLPVLTTGYKESTNKWNGRVQSEAVSVPGDEYIRALQDACDIIQADANTEENYASLCRIGSVLAKFNATPTKADEPPKEQNNED